MATDRACEDAVRTTLPGSLAPLSSNVGSLYGSALDLERTVSRPITMEEKSTKSAYSYRFSCKTRPELKIASRRFPRQWPPRRPRLQVLNKFLGASWIALPLWKKVQPLALAAPTRQDLGTCSNMVTAPQPLGLSGPMAQAHLMTIGIRDVSPEDEHARSAVLLLFPSEQYNTGVTNWINNFWETSNIPAYNKPVRIHCKAGSV